MTEPRILTLPPHLDLRAAASLKTDIEACGAASIEIDASRVERIGAPCLQVLLAAAKASSAGGRGWRITSSSEAFRDDARAMGAIKKLHIGDGGTAGSCAC